MNRARSAGGANVGETGPWPLPFAASLEMVEADAEPMRGSSHILIMESRDSADRLFAKLQVGGRVTTPLEMQPWGSYFGKLTDRYGVQWMLDCEV